MTIKEIATTAGCNEKTVKRIVAEKFPGKMQHGKVTRFTWEEAHALMAILPKRNMVSDLGQMSSVPTANVLSSEVAAGSSLTSRDLDMISAIVSRTVAMTIQQLDVRLSKIETRVEERQALLPAPKIKPRDHISKLVREYAERNHVEFRTVWSDLYREFGYRTNTNPKKCAESRGMSIIDYLDAEGQIGTLEAVALDHLGGAS